MKKYFPYIILLSVIISIGISSCKKKEIIKTITTSDTLHPIPYSGDTTDYTSLIAGNYLMGRIKDDYWGGNSITDTLSDTTINIIAYNDSMLQTLGTNFKYSINNSDSIYSYFFDETPSQFLYNCLNYMKTTGDLTIDFGYQISAGSGGDMHYYSK